MHLLLVGRKFYGTCMIGLGIQQFIHAGFLPVFLPAWPASLPGVNFFAYFFGAMLIVIGAAILLEKNTPQAALITGAIFLVLVLFVHLPHLVLVNPYSNHLGTWTQAFKLLALSGGAFVLAGSYEGIRSPSSNVLNKIIPLGSVFFAVTMIVFGIDHFLYVEMVATLIPNWIPGHIFWTYFAAIALIGSGLAIILKIKLKWIGILLGLMIFLWFILLHIPRAIADPVAAMGNEVTGAFQALGFSGIAFMIAGRKKSSD